MRALPVLGISGINVTMPHKAAAARACDELSEAAARLGSVNTVAVRSDGSCLGDSTDGEGFLRSLDDAGLDARGRDVIILGSGGAAHAVAAALVDLGASVRVAAPPRARPRPASRAAVHGVRVQAWPARGPVDAEIVVNATPIGMGTDPAEPVEPAPDQWIVDLVYHPLETPWLRRAREVGAHPVGGLGMLVHQAALSFERWTGVAAPLDAMRAAAIGAQ